MTSRSFCLFVLIATSTIAVVSAVKRVGGYRRLSYDVGDECEKCPFDTFYHYEDGQEDRLRPEFIDPPNDCTLAAIRDMAAVRGAQSAIPRGKIAITQGYVPFDDLVEYCLFDNAKTEEEVVSSCGEYGYNEFFKNWEDSDVPKDPSCWVNFTFPVPSGKVHLGIGSDGALRPISQVNNFASEGEPEYDGAVYECCPVIDDICNEVPAPDTTRLR